MRPPASFAFQLSAGRAETARGKRPSLSAWPRRGRRGRNPLSRLAVAPADASPDVDPPRTSGASEVPQDEEATS